MKLWLCLTATAALLVTGCDDKDTKKASSRPASSAPARAAFAEESAPDNNPASLALTSQARGQTDALSGAARDQGPDAGRRFFDGQTLRAGGFVAPDESVVLASGGGSRKPLPPYTRASSRRGPKDLTTPAPPSPDGLDAASSPEAQAQGAGKVLGAFDAFQRRMFSVASPIMSRSGWHAAKRKGSPVAMHPTHVTVHHTQGLQTMSAADTAAAVRNIQHYHMAGRAAEGKDTWDDIGYHFLIDGSGRVAEGRPAETLGAHAGGANQDNVGISMMGDFNRQTPTAAQIESLTRLVSFLAIKYGQNPSRQGFLEPHRHYDQTDCPGKNMMAILASLRQSIDDRTNMIMAQLAGAEKGKFVPVLTTDA